jgi:hypothetical protein
MKIEQVKIEGGPKPEPTRYFPMAEHLRAVAPALVHEDPDGRLGVGLGDVVGLLWDAVRQLSAQVRELRGESAPPVIDDVQDPARWTDPPKKGPHA